MDIVSAILSPIVVYLNHGNDHLPEGQFFVLRCYWLILLKNYNRQPKCSWQQRFVPTLREFICRFFNIMKTEIKNKLGKLGMSFTQPSLVSSRNASPHKRLLRIELHSFPFVFVVQRTNQSCIRNLTIREPQDARKRTRLSGFDKSSNRRRIWTEKCVQLSG